MMFGMHGVGRTLVFAGALILLLGLLVSFGERLPFRIGRLPGDFVIRGKGSIFYFPLATSLLLSVILSLAVWLLNKR
jgi:hypothetical protein